MCARSRHDVVRMLPGCSENEGPGTAEIGQEVGRLFLDVGVKEATVRPKAGTMERECCQDVVRRNATVRQKVGTMQVVCTHDVADVKARERLYRVVSAI